jgi:hypothetical protein
MPEEQEVVALPAVPQSTLDKTNERFDQLA